MIIFIMGITVIISVNVLMNMFCVVYRYVFFFWAFDTNTYSILFS